MKKTTIKFAALLVSALMFAGCLGNTYTESTRSFSGRNTFYKDPFFNRIEISKAEVDGEGNLKIQVAAENRKEEYEADYYIVSHTFKTSPHAPKAFFLTAILPVNLLLAPIASNSSFKKEFSDLKNAYFGNTISTTHTTEVENESPTGNSSFEPIRSCSVEVTANDSPLHHVPTDTFGIGSVPLNSLVEDFKSVPDYLTLRIKASYEQKSTRELKSTEKTITLNKKQLAALSLPAFNDISDFTKAKKTNTLKAWATYMKNHPESKRNDEVLAGMADIIKKSIGVKSSIAYLETYSEGKKHFPVIAGLLDAGPEKLTVKEILKFKQQGIGETFIISKVSRSKQGYRDFSFDEIGVLKQMGLTDNLIQAMIDVTFRLEETALKNQQIASLRAENEELRRKTIQVQQNNAVTAPEAAQQNTFTDVVAEELKKEAAKKVAEKILDFF